MVGFECHRYSKEDDDNDMSWFADPKELWAAKERCNETVLTQPYPEDGRVYCPAKWDGKACWNYTLANTTTSIQCPEYIHVFDNKQGHAFHVCKEDGEWWGKEGHNTSWANYLGCMHDTQQANRVVDIYIVGYSISVLSLILSLCIFTYFKQLSCVRVTVHKNLFVTFIFTGISWILYYTTVVKNHQVLADNPIWCQLLHVFCQYFVTCNFSWMFCEGLYLHTIILNGFIKESKKLLAGCCLIGWGVPILITVSYSLVRGLALDNTDMCWLYDCCSQWIIFGPIILSLVGSCCFLIHIIKVLRNTFRSVHTHDNSQNKKATRAALILIPLLGLQFLLFPVEPPDGTIAEHIFQCLSALVVSFQGFMVSMIYCFCNAEVLSQAKRTCRCYKYLPLRAAGSRFNRPRGSAATELTTTGASDNSYSHSQYNSH